MTPPPLPATTAFVTLLGRISIVLAVLVSVTFLVVDTVQAMLDPRVEA